MQNITLLKEQTTNTEPPSLTELRLTLKQKFLLNNQDLSWQINFTIKFRIIANKSSNFQILFRNIYKKS
jgi:hypothetical protein